MRARRTDRRFLSRLIGGAVLAALMLVGPGHAGTRRGKGCNCGAGMLSEGLRPHLWRISRFRYARVRSRASAKKKYPQARFLANLPEDAEPANLGIGDPLLVYELEDGRIRIAGHARVERLKDTRRGRQVEASVLGFRYAEAVRLPPSGTTWRLQDGASPKRARWFLASGLIGQDVADWDEKRTQAFLTGRPWEGMPVRAFLSITGLPEETQDLGFETRLFFSGGAIKGAWIEGERLKSVARF